jgi:hypothetical protein
LPSWFTVTTPVGDYNPDWTSVIENPEGGDDLLYLVRGTKGSLNPMTCDSMNVEKSPAIGGISQIPLKVNYRVVTSASHCRVKAFRAVPPTLRPSGLSGSGQVGL